METIKSISARADFSGVGCEYSLAVIAKAGSKTAFGVAAKDTCEHNELCIKELGADKELAISVVDILNKYRIPYVHFLDVINDLMNV